MAAVAERLGQPLMPWQQLVADVAGELVVVDGITVPAYRDVVVTVPRQSGKTTLVLSWMIQRAHGWGRPQRIAYSAQTGNDARKKLVEDWEPLLKPHLKALGMGRILKGMGNEAVPFHNGSRIVLLASSEDSGHGKTIGLGVKDELFADVDYRRDQALVPAMATIDDAQVLTTSTAGTDASIPLNAAVKRGRAAVEADVRDTIAYFEWSAAEDDELDDPETWWTFMPALGHTQSIRSIEAARQTLSDQPGEFRRAFGNIATVSNEMVIPMAAWDAVCLGDPVPSGGLVLAVDMEPDRRWTSIAIADAEGRLDIVDHRPGSGWVRDRIADLVRRWDAPVALDPSAPIGSMRDDLDGVAELVEISGREYGQACGDFYDAVMNGTLQVRRSAPLDAAISGAKKRTIGDAWAWARRNVSVDISPLIAATLARWAALHKPAVDMATQIH